MLNSIDELNPLLKGSVLERQKFECFEIPGTGGNVLAAKLKGAGIFECWQAARELLDKTGRWPLIVDVSFAGMLDGFNKKLLDVALSRFPFEDEKGRAWSPQDIVEASKDLDVDAVFEKSARQNDEYDEDCDWLLEEIEGTLGRRPGEADLDASIPYKAHRIDRWAYEQELQDEKAPDPLEGRPHLFDPRKPALLLLPVDCGWETLAWASWYGAEGADAEVVAVLRRWHEQYGAELYANYGTMLEFKVSKPPTNPMDAWKLASQHDLLAPSNLASPGLTVRQYAQGLIGHDRWFLHERP